MCGFVGIINSNKPVDKELLIRMRDTLVHRGPDDSGIYLKENVGLGFRRLAIIDLQTGNQPISNSEGTIRVVFNGEIYNYRELRSELEREGHVFTTQSDSETIVQGYERYGESIFQKLNGMFAIAIWDSRKKKTFLARDRAGEKPLHYFWNGETLVFGSEIKALLPHPEISREEDWLAFDEFFSYGFISPPKTIYRKVRKIRPGHCLVLEHGDIKEEPFWELDPTRSFTGDFAEAKMKTLELLRDAIRIRMRSDVPLGAFLSGGVDSSAIVALMAEQSKTPVKTFTIGFEEEDYNESRFAKLVADRYQTDHTSLIVTSNYHHLIERVLQNFDEPFGDSSALPTFLVSELTRKHVTVSLSGDGGDELFGGYSSYQNLLRQSRLINSIPSPMRSIAPMLSPLFHPASKPGRWSQAIGMDENDRFIWSLTHFKPKEKEALYSEHTKAAIRGLQKPDDALEQKRQFMRFPSINVIQRAQYCDFMHYQPDDILVKVDRTSMLVSLESRAPFLDHRIIEHAFSLPTDWKVKETQTKILLKSALRGTVPDPVLDRGKMGFGVPIRHWFSKELYQYCRERLLGRSLEPYLNEKTVQKYLQEHKEGTLDHSQKIWFMLSLAVWMRANR